LAQRDDTAEVRGLFEDFAAGRLDRRSFMRRSAALGIGVAAAAAMDALAAGPTQAQVADLALAARTKAPVKLAEWSYFWVGAKRAELARGTVASGSQMYVEYWTPAEVKHPFSMVIVHGGGGQGLDWLGACDGRPGWVTYLLQAGYRVYLVDRPGHGRSPFHPSLHGAFPAQAATYARTERQFSAPEKASDPYGPEALKHTQWPGTGQLGDPSVDQVIAYQGNSFLPDLETTHRIWAERGGELLDRIGPAVVMAHSMGGPSCWIYANARPNLVKGCVGVEPGGPPFGPLRWGLTASPMVYDPPVAEASELKTVEVKPSEAGRATYRIQAEPARKLKNLRNIPIAVVTSEASYHWPYDLGSVAFLRQAGCTVDHIELEKIGILGNAHFMMEEKNNREVLQPILDWLETKVSAPMRKAGAKIAAPAVRPAGETTAMDLADQGFFWVGVERKKTPYGVIAGAPMYIQYLTPKELRHQTPIVLAHGEGGQMLHYMGPGGGAAGWAHYYVQAGYKVYLVDLPGHGRCVYHPDALGPIAAQPTYEPVLADFRRAKAGGRWAGTAALGDPAIDQFMASQNAPPADKAMQAALWRSRGAMLLDAIGPAIIQTHSTGGGFGWATADERPGLVKGLVSFEGSAAPLIQPGQNGAAPQVRAMPNLKDLSVLYVSAANSGRSQGPAVVEALKASGARAEHLSLKDRGVDGNGHYAMLENNRKAVFDQIRTWVDQRA